METNQHRSYREIEELRKRRFVQFMPDMPLDVAERYDLLARAEGREAAIRVIESDPLPPDWRPERIGRCGQCGMQVEKDVPCERCRQERKALISHQRSCARGRKLTALCFVALVLAMLGIGCAMQSATNHLEALVRDLQ